jgi:hypothetical protein
MPRNIELPTVIYAPQTRALIAAVVEADTAMRAEFLEQANAPFTITKRHKPLTEQRDPLWRSVWL